MARNEEKQLGRLNRLWLQKERDAYNAKNPKRPRLSDLNTADEISQWLPSIKDEIDFYLKQTECPVYSDRKIKEVQSKISTLERQYHAFARKLRKVDSTVKVTPWTPRPYGKTWTPESSNLPDLNAGSAACLFERLPTPILDCHPPADFTSLVQVDHPLQDEPLEFEVPSPKEAEVVDDESKSEESTAAETEKAEVDRLGAIRDSREAKLQRAQLERIFGVGDGHGGNILGIDYSSSDED